MRKAQLTITDPQDQITSKLHLLKKEHQINISSFCRDYVGQGIEKYLKKISYQKTTNTPCQSNETNNPFYPGFKMTKKVNTDAYLEFVNAVTSAPSKDADAFEYRIQELRGEGFETWRLLTAAVGMSAEAGEFTEVVKKIIFQGKPANEENLFHLKRELGDIMWYVAQACMGLNISLDEIIEMNVDKLKSRYPGGEFDVHYSENRKDGDV